MSSRTERTLKTAALALLAFLPAGCSEYLQRTDRVALHAGDAVAANRTIHTIDPWPAAANRAEIDVSARKVAQAIERYEMPAAPPGAVPLPPGVAP